MTRNFLFLCFASLIGLSACSKDPAINRGVGAPVTSTLAKKPSVQKDEEKTTISADILIGALTSTPIANQLTPQDRAFANRALEHGLNNGRPQKWQNPNSNASGNFYPETLVQSNTGRYCRSYSQTIVSNGNSQSATGRACRKPDNSWDIIR
jgi:surface antigen